MATGTDSFRERDFPCFQFSAINWPALDCSWMAVRADKKQPPLNMHIKLASTGK